jgi:glycosyltransferase involved in cell wall biosynthesis
MPRALIILCNRYAFDARSQRHAEALAERGYETDVICLASPAIVKQHERVNLIELNWRRYQGSRRLNYLRTYSRFFSAAALIALRKSAGKAYDVILASTMPDPIVLCALPARLFGGRIVLDIRDTMPELYQEKFGKGPDDAGTRMLFAQERFCARLANRVIAVHEPHRLRLEKAGIPREKLDIVMNTPDPRIFTPSSRRASNNHGPSDTFTLIYHGTVTRRLGLDVAIHAVSLLRDRIPSLRMIALGTGDELPSVKSLAASLNLGDRITFPDTTPVEKLPEILSQADLGVVPNRATVATQLMLPVKLLEYAMSEVPAVAPRLSTIQYYFNDDTVRYFTPGDPVDLSNAIHELYKNPTRRKDQARRAAEVASRLSWASEKEKFNRIIDSVTGWSFAESRPLVE